MEVGKFLIETFELSVVVFQIAYFFLEGEYCGFSLLFFSKIRDYEFVQAIDFLLERLLLLIKVALISIRMELRHDLELSPQVSFTYRPVLQLRLKYLVLCF